MANAKTTTFDEAVSEPENGTEIGRSWIAALLILLAVGVYLNADIEKRRAGHAPVQIVSQANGPMAMR